MILNTTGRQKRFAFWECGAQEHRFRWVCNALKPENIQSPLQISPTDESAAHAPRTQKRWLAFPQTTRADQHCYFSRNQS